MSSMFKAMLIADDIVIVDVRRIGYDLRSTFYNTWLLNFEDKSIQATGFLTPSRGSK